MANHQSEVEKLSASIAALEARKHVLLEKPMATNAKDALKIVETAKKMKRVLMVAQNFRFDRHAQMARQSIDRGDLGAPPQNVRVNAQEAGATGRLLAELPRAIEITATGTRLSEPPEDPPASPTSASPRAPSSSARTWRTSSISTPRSG